MSDPSLDVPMSELAQPDSQQRPAFPLPAYLNFVPGGVSYRDDSSRWHHLGHAAGSGAFSPRANRKMGQLIQEAKLADDRLRQYSLVYGAQDNVTPGHFLPSLSILAQAVFGRFTGCPPNQAKAWADALVNAFWDAQDPGMPADEADIWNKKPRPQQPVHGTETALQRLKQNAQVINQGHNRPCGYVFQRGDIAWNCRTCQTDATCVICDDCFQQSDHKGHEVYFHRTTPGGCCDCGDAEAWKTEGCCDRHRPKTAAGADEAKDDPMEAVRTAQRGLAETMETMQILPPRFTAALAVVVGAAVQALVDTVDGAGVGADPVQWKRRWADEAAKIANGVAYDEDYAIQGDPKVPHLNQSFHDLPGYNLQLRLHNDDVHTFDEVIEALHEPRVIRRNEERNTSLVTLRDQATEMTHHVDADGQVTVKQYTNTATALHGFQKLKRRGLHCAVVSSVQVQAEHRTRALSTWLSEIASAHPVAAALVVDALVQTGDGHALGGSHVWKNARTIPFWAGLDCHDEQEDCRRRFAAFPPHLPSSFVTREEASTLYFHAMEIHPQNFVQLTGTSPDFYAKVPYRLPSLRYHKSPHALWGILPAQYSDPIPVQSKHPLLHRLSSSSDSSDYKLVSNTLTEHFFVVDTDLRKQQEADKITSTTYPHRLPGLHLISGVGSNGMDSVDNQIPPRPSPMDYRHLLGTSSFRAPISSMLLLLLLDPYPTKQVRSAIHAMVLSLLTDARFKSRFAAALGVAYRPLSTLFCAGVGTDADTPLHFTVQIFTAGSLVRALGSAPAMQHLLVSDDPEEDSLGDSSIGVFTSPIAHTIVRCIHTNLLGATKEVNMILNNTTTGNNDNEEDPINHASNDGLLSALTYVAGQHPLMSMLPAAPDDGFLDSRSTRHKRLPHLLRDLEYVIETPGTALRLLLPQHFPVYEGPSLSFRGEGALAFPDVFARMLRLAQGMDPQKRKINGGHVEYEQNRWLEAFGLSLNFAGARDALCESPSRGVPLLGPESTGSAAVREALGHVAASLLREMKLWLYREGMLETGLPVPSVHGGLDLVQVESLQRSTLHVSGSRATSRSPSNSSASTVALSCATGIKMTETQLNLIENALKAEVAERLHGLGIRDQTTFTGAVAPVMGDWLRVPHAPLSGDSLSFHLPLHRALAQCIRCVCSLVVPETARTNDEGSWWKLPVLDAATGVVTNSDPSVIAVHPLVPVIKSTLRAINCKVVWTSGPDNCSPGEAQRRRSRSRTVSANIAVSKVIHSIADHPIRCLAAAQQIERHLWARNGTSVGGMAMNYSSTPLCRSFRDLDLLLVQVSAAGMSVGLGARRVYALLLSRFSMEGYLVDPEKRSPSRPNSSPWMRPPRLQDPDHAVVLSESFFSTICVLVSELPPPPPTSPGDDAHLRQSIRRELLHAFAAEPRSRSEAISAASVGVVRKEDSEGNLGGSASGGLFKNAFATVLNEIAKPRTQAASRANSGPPAFELKPDYCDEYDPSFFHLRRNEHQHAMDVIVRLRRQKLGEDSDRACLPVVAPPPKAHPRFLTCRLLLHLDSIDASIRRALLFALSGGSWLPPCKPEPAAVDVIAALDGTDSNSLQELAGIASSLPSSTSDGGDVTVTTFTRNALFQSASSKRSEIENVQPFTAEVVASSSVSFLEVLQLLTLQVHTLEECASLHRTLPGIDEESRTISFGLSINSYLGRLVKVPGSLVDAWALQPYPAGPLQSSGSGEMRGSILGLLITLFEHRGDQGNNQASDADGDDGHGGARALTSSGLKWLLRFVHSLVEGAPSVSAAIKSASSGTRLTPTKNSPAMSVDSDGSSWTIDERVRKTIIDMLSGLGDLWPKKREGSPVNGDKASVRNKEAGKAAQRKMMDLMKQRQVRFAATIGPTEESSKGGQTGDEADLCIICRCDDADGENNGPIGYLGHVQRSRAGQIRACSSTKTDQPAVGQTYRVVGHKGCQLRRSEAMDSKALTCLPRGSVVTVMKTCVSPEYDILSRRVLVSHRSTDPHTRLDVVTEGWASIQSSQGYVILSPLISLCYTNSRWGATRPVIKQCGHAAHLKCVETHTLSLHQRAAGDQPYDGRFAANIADGEFLCPLCKQLSNILIPKDDFEGRADKSSERVSMVTKKQSIRDLLSASSLTVARLEGLSDMERRARQDFGSQFYNAMVVPWERSRKKQQQWHPAIQKWDYEEAAEKEFSVADSSVGSILRLFRQQLISWAAIGHTAASAEASSRSVEEVLEFGTFAQTEDAWHGYGVTNRDSHPMLIELKRALTGASGLLEYLSYELTVASEIKRSSREEFIFSSCLSDILDGWSWVLGTSSNSAADQLGLWSEITALTAALPCHVASDGSIPLRSEARATVAAMWVSKGIGTSGGKDSEPPVPLPVLQLFLNNSDMPSLPSDWGTMDPMVLPSEFDPNEKPRNPFRPAVAGAFLYTPLLAWDLATLSGAVLSTMLLNKVEDLPSPDEFIGVAHRLMVGRIVQAIVTPGGFDVPDDMELDEQECWNEEEVSTQGDALIKLVGHCRSMTKQKCLNTNSPLLVEDKVDYTGSALLAGVGMSILPFNRTLLLLLRACWSAISDRQEQTTGGTTSGERAEAVESILTDDNLMTVEDGFLFLKSTSGPTPSDLIDSSQDWFSLINRWLVAVVSLELHHGSMGRHIVPNLAETGENFTLADNVPSRTESLPLLTRRASGSSSDVDMQDADDDAGGDSDQQANHARLASLDRALVAAGFGEEEESDQDVDEVAIGSPEEAVFGDEFSGVGNDSDQNEDVGESSEEYSESGSDQESESRESDRKFANSSRSPILSYQPSLLGIEEIGPGRHGSLFEFSKASEVMADFSHMGMKHIRNLSSFSLIRLPKSFVELYTLVNKVKGREESTNEEEDNINSETAICLLTGTVMRSGAPRKATFGRSQRPHGACTMHARSIGSGIGIFFLVQKCTVLLMHNNKSAYSPSLYVDEHGEEDPGLRRGRPLFLNESRYRALEQQWRQQGIPRQVAQIRSTSDRVIRDNWY